MISLSERRQQILDEIAGLERLQRGYISEQFLNRERGGKKFRFGPYYLLQHGNGKRRVCKRVAADKLAEVQAEVNAWRRFESLAEEFVRVTEQMTLEDKQDHDIKKNEKRFSKANIKKAKGF